jgi:hypothetical protein
VSSRLMRTLLRLYPRRIRERYGDELLDLQEELRAQGNISRARQIQDMLGGALLVRRSRGMRVVIGTAIVVGGLAVAGAAISGLGTAARPGPIRAWLRAAVKSPSAVPHESCFVSDSSSCSVTPCHEFVTRIATETAGQPNETPVIGAGTKVAPGKPRVTQTQCTAYPRAQGRRVFVSGSGWRLAVSWVGA